MIVPLRAEYIGDLDRGHSVMVDTFNHIVTGFLNCFAYGFAFDSEKSYSLRIAIPPLCLGLLRGRLPRADDPNRSC